MGRRIIVGILWGIVLYFAVCAITGGVVGLIVAAKAAEGANGDQVAAESRQAAFNIVSSIRLYFLTGAVIISAIGIWQGFLPGMGTKKSHVE
jgi:hypothetical protein